MYRDQEDVPIARVRADLDKYRTPDWMTEALVSSFPAIKGSVLCDPCCGESVLTRWCTDTRTFVVMCQSRVRLVCLSTLGSAMKCRFVIIKENNDVRV